MGNWEDDRPKSMKPRQKSSRKRLELRSEKRARYLLCGRYFHRRILDDAARGVLHVLHRTDDGTSDTYRRARIVLYRWARHRFEYWGPSGETLQESLVAQIINCLCYQWSYLYKGENGKEYLKLNWKSRDKWKYEHK